MMPSEVESWVAFYNAHPFDDHHRYYRPAALVASAPFGIDLGEALAWLARETPPEKGYSEAELSVFRTFGVTPPNRKN